MDIHKLKKIIFPYLYHFLNSQYDLGLVLLSYSRPERIHPNHLQSIQDISILRHFKNHLTCKKSDQHMLLRELRLRKDEWLRLHCRSRLQINEKNIYQVIDCHPDELRGEIYHSILDSLNLPAYYLDKLYKQILQIRNEYKQNLVKTRNSNREIQSIPTRNPT